MMGTVANILEVITAVLTAVALAWKYRHTLGGWYYEIYCTLFNPGKKGRNATASITVQVVGVSKARHDPFSGERFTIRSNAVHAPPMPDADEQRRLIFRLPPE